MVTALGITKCQLDNEHIKNVEAPQKMTNTFGETEKSGSSKQNERYANNLWARSKENNWYGLGLLRRAWKTPCIRKKVCDFNTNIQFRKKATTKPIDQSNDVSFELIIFAQFSKLSPTFKPRTTTKSKCHRTPCV